MGELREKFTANAEEFDSLMVKMLEENEVYHTALVNIVEHSGRTGEDSYDMAEYARMALGTDYHG